MMPRQRLILVALALTAAEGIALGQPVDAIALAQEASAAMRARDFGTAERIYRQLVDMFPEQPGLALNLGLAFYSAGNLPGAIEQLDRFLEAEPDHAPAWLLVGMSYQKLDNPSRAIGPLRRAVMLDPDNNTARLELADALLRSDQPERARSEFSLLANQDRENPKAWLGLGLSYTELSSVAAGDLEHTAPNSAYYQLLLARSAQAQAGSGPLSLTIGQPKRSTRTLPASTRESPRSTRKSGITTGLAPNSLNALRLSRANGDSLNAGSSPIP